MKWEWTVGSQTVSFDYNFMLSTKRLTVGGKNEPVQRGTWRSETDFKVGADTARLRFALRYFLMPEATLEVGGQPFTPHVAPPKPAGWTWAFVTANLAILVVAIGGAIPGAIAGVGAVSCIGASMSQRSEWTRILLCALVTAAAWAAFWGLVMAAR